MDRDCWRWNFEILSLETGNAFNSDARGSRTRCRSFFVSPRRSRRGGASNGSRTALYFTSGKSVRGPSRAS